MTPERKEAVRKLADLKNAFTETHPGITVAFDLAKAALIQAIDGPDTLTVSDLTLRMLKAVMDAGFVIIHRGEIENTILAAAQAGRILHALPAEPQLKQ